MPQPLAMAGLFTLLALSLVMAVASFVAGILPLSFSLSQSQLRMISTIGMGVLVGTSLIVIIPEEWRRFIVPQARPKYTREELHSSMLFDVRWSAPNIPRQVWSLDRRADPFDMPGPVVPGIE